MKKQIDSLDRLAQLVYGEKQYRRKKLHNLINFGNIFKIPDSVMKFGTKSKSSSHYAICITDYSKYLPFAEVIPGTSKFKNNDRRHGFFLPANTLSETTAYIFNRKEGLFLLKLPRKIDAEKFFNFSFIGTLPQNLKQQLRRRLRELIAL